MIHTLALLATLAVPGGSSADQTSDQVLTRIAFGSCAKQGEPQPIWEPVVATEPQLFLFLGDNIYADTSDVAVMRKKYQQLADDPGYRKLTDTCPILATWDDHDYGRNDAGVEYPKKVESQKELLDFFGVPADSPRRDRKGVYHSVTYGPEGKRVQVIMLDTRYFRSPLKKGEVSPGVSGYLPNRDDGATVLGEEQWEWLEQQLREPADLRLVGSSIQVISEEHRFEKWMNTPAERQRLFDLIRETEAEGVVFLSGDRHHAELSWINAGVGYPLYDLTSSGLNQGFEKWRPIELNRHRVATMFSGDNFGLIKIDWDAEEPAVELQIRDVDGEVTIRQKLLLSTLKRGTLGGGLVGKPKVIEGVLTVEDAAKSLNAVCTVELNVKSTGQSRNGEVIYLNSKENFRDEDNFTIMLIVPDLKDQVEGLSREMFEGKKVRLTGLVERNDYGPRIIIREGKNISVMGN